MTTTTTAAHTPIHFHSSEPVFCGSREIGRRFTIYPNEVTCQDCLAKDAMQEALQAFLEWHADNFEDFADETNMELLCLANMAEAAIQKARGGQ